MSMLSWESVLSKKPGRRHECGQCSLVFGCILSMVSLWFNCAHRLTASLAVLIADAPVAASPQSSGGSNAFWMRDHAGRDARHGAGVYTSHAQHETGVGLRGLTWGRAPPVGTKWPSPREARPLDPTQPLCWGREEQSLSWSSWQSRAFKCTGDTAPLVLGLKF